MNLLKGILAVRIQYDSIETANLWLCMKFKKT